jgi:hypothetical protein
LEKFHFDSLISKYNLWKTNNYSPCSTGSYTGSSALNSVNSYAGGGTWWTGSIQTWFNTNTYPISASQTFNYKYDNDANFNVTNIIRAQYTGAISSDGFIVKQDPEFVQNVNYQPELKFYSVDTNTIYPPQLQFNWRDYTFITGASNPQTTLNSLP